jgi:hypothetical protein
MIALFNEKEAKNSLVFSKKKLKTKEIVIIIIRCSDHLSKRAFFFLKKVNHLIK